MESCHDYLQQNRQRFVEQLKEWLRIPSISTDSRYQTDVATAARFIASDLESIGLDVEIIATRRHPIVYAESPAAAGMPTALIYGHYDVQPPEPLDEWVSQPFEPTERDGDLYARGATDDKGQLFTHVKAVEAWMKTSKLPINVKFLIEGEEEIGSPNLVPFVDTNRQRLACDYAVVSDTAQYSRGLPAITYGLKGLVYFEVCFSGPKQDLHSGVFGGSVANPANNLAQAIAGLHDQGGRVALPGYYDEVIPLADWERAQFAELPFDEQQVLEFVGVNAGYGEQSYTTLERRWARPTCDVNGLTSGYQGEGAKTIIPAKASVKVSFRLVPNQDPQKVAERFRQYIESCCWPGIKCEIHQHASAPAVLVPVDSPAVQAAGSAIEQGFNRKPVFIREGGSIPVVGTFKEILGVDTLLLGWGQNDDNLHSPNEKFSIADFHAGTRSSAFLWKELAEAAGEIVSKET